MKKNVPIVIYRNWLATFTSLPAEDVGLIIKALAVHVMTGETPTLEPTLEIVKEQLIAEVDEGLAKYFAKCEKNKQIADEREAKKAKEEHERDTNVPRASGNSNSKTNSKTNNLSNDKLEREELTSSSRSRFVPPTIEEVKAYAFEKGLVMDAEEFVDHYIAIGWMIGKSPMRDWKATARNWARREKTMKPTPIKKEEQKESALEYIARLQKEADERERNNNPELNGSFIAGIPGTVQENVQ